MYEIMQTITAHYPCTAYLLMILGHAMPLALLEASPHHDNPRGVIRASPTNMESLLRSALSKHSHAMGGYEDIVEDVFTYEHTLYELHSLETPTELFESQLVGEQGMPSDLDGYYVRLSPNAIAITLQHDIDSIIESIRNGGSIGDPRRLKTNYIMYENGLNNELSTLRKDDTSSYLIELARKNLTLLSFLDEINKEKNSGELRELFETLWADGLFVVAHSRPSKV